MGDQPLHYRSMTGLAAMLRSGEVTPTGLTAHLIERIEALNGPLNAFNLVTADRAMAEARSAEALLASGRDLGPLHGIPYAVKDLYDVVGLPTTAGSRTLDDTPKTEESEVTRRLAAAGMIVLGKTVTVEFAKASWASTISKVRRTTRGARRPACRAGRAPARLSRSRQAWRRWDWGPIPAARFARRPVSPGRSGSNRPSGGSADSVFFR